MISFKYRFYNRSRDGLLKVPDVIGPYYDEDQTLQESFDSEEEAVYALDSLLREDKENEFVIDGLILVKEICVS